MFGKKTKELKELLTQKESENEILKKRVCELEDEVKRMKEQEDFVVRALTEANKTAARIEAEAGEAHDKLIAEAEQHVREAEEEAANVLSKAGEEAESVRKDADDYSENIRTDANIYVERTIIASQLEVKKRKDVMAELNELLKKTTDYLNEQTETFANMLKTVIEDNEEQTKELCYEIEKCNCSCDECKDPCMAHAGKKPSKGDGEDEDEEDGEEGEDESEETASFEESEPAEETPAEETPDAACADEEAAPSDVDPSSLPDEYDSPAQLMKNIYYLQKRELPENRETRGTCASVIELPREGNSDEVEAS